MRYEPFLLLSLYRVFFRVLIAVWLPGPVSWGSDPRPASRFGFICRFYYLCRAGSRSWRMSFLSFGPFYARMRVGQDFLSDLPPHHTPLRAYEIQFSGIGARSPFASIAESRKFKRGGADSIQKKKGLPVMACPLILINAICVSSQN